MHSSDNTEEMTNKYIKTIYFLATCLSAKIVKSKSRKKRLKLPSNPWDLCHSSMRWSRHRKYTVCAVVFPLERQLPGAGAPCRWTLSTLREWAHRWGCAAQRGQPCLQHCTSLNMGVKVSGATEGSRNVAPAQHWRNQMERHNEAYPSPFNWQD